jgi:dynein heavy chain
MTILKFQSVTKMSDRYYEEMRRKFYTTPSSYLELINLYTSMLNERRDKIYSGKARIQNGLTVNSFRSL